MQSFARVTTLCWALGSALPGCSSASLTGSTPDEAVGEERLALPLSYLQAVRAYRLPSLVSISALDSQNAMPSGLLVDPSLRYHLLDLARSRLSAGSPAVAALRAAPGGGGDVLLKYLARCALRESDTTVLPGYPGRLGLAYKWQSRGLDRSEQHWITACLMAHTNNLATVPIAVTGTLPTFSTAGTSTAKALDYPYEEAAFYGNLFENVPQLFACSGVGTQASCSDRGVGEDLQRRLCGTSNASQCGFQYMHECNLPAPSGALMAGACSAASPGSPYADCVGAKGVRIAEVITASLRTDAALLGLHPACTQTPEPSCSPPAHELCTIGARLGAGCSGGVCADDPYCCTRIWDSSCVAKARSAGLCP